MITPDQLVDLARRFVLYDDEPIEWRKDFPDEPSAHIQTADRAFSIAPARGWLRVEEAPWVEAVVVVRREHQDVGGAMPRDAFLVRQDGTVVPLGDQAAVAGLGPLVHEQRLHPMAFAELLVTCQWPGGRAKRLILDPAAWRAGYPAEAALPQVDEPRVRRGDGELGLTFTASREYAQTVGGRQVLEVAQWSVTVPVEAPATWERRTIAPAVPLTPPW